MSVPTNVTSAEFLSDKDFVACTPRSAFFMHTGPMELASSLSGGPFSMVTFSQDRMFAVAHTDTPPFTPVFVLTYQLETGMFVKSMEFPTPILKLAANKEFLFVSIESSIQVFQINNLEKIAMIERKSQNGIFTVSDGLIAFSEDNEPGIVTIATIDGFSIKKKIQCHKETIQRLKISKNNKYLITCSTKGTIIRKYSIDNPCDYWEYRRGYRPASVVDVDTTENIATALTITTLHIFLNDYSHITVPMHTPALACRIINDAVAVISTDGLLSTYVLNANARTAQMITQHRILSVALINTDSRKNRRTTF